MTSLPPEALGDVWPLVSGNVVHINTERHTHGERERKWRITREKSALHLVNESEALSP